MLFWLFSLTLSASAEPPVVHRVTIGSYGRVLASTDLHGGLADPIAIAAHPPRLWLPPYLELDLRWDGEVEDGPRFGAVVTPAFSGDLFHYDGDFANKLALRNLYAVAHFDRPLPIEIWAGSRLYRGDDVYLLDFWPMDDQNTVGGGVSVRPGPVEVAGHVGVHRLLGDDWQFQEIAVITPDGVQADRVVVLDRQRVVGSLRAGIERAFGPVTLRARLYGEAHALPAGERVVDDPFTEWVTQPLPPDHGYAVGMQLSAWGWADGSFAHLWIVEETGLAAVGELTIPHRGFDDSLRVANSRTFRIAVAENTDTRWFGVMAGGYVENRVDADGIAVDFDDRWEWVAVVRPTAWLGRWFSVGLELSHEHVRPNGLNPRTGDWDRPDLTRLSLLPAVQLGRGGFQRPRLHLLYTASFLDRDARDFFDEHDARIHSGVQHAIGIGAEWWIDSSTREGPR